jgi:hypothetical protein
MSARRMIMGTFLGLGALFMASTVVAPVADADADAKSPVAPASVRVVAAPVPVTSLNCDGDTNKCTAGLRFGDGKWFAEWNVNVFHQTAAGAVAARSSASPRGASAPVPVTTFNCDGDTGKCTAGLRFGDGKWFAQWNATVFHQAMASATPAAAAKAAAKAAPNGTGSANVAGSATGSAKTAKSAASVASAKSMRGAAAPVPVTALRGAAAPVPVTALRGAAAPVPVTALNCDGDTGKCTANLQFGDGKWVAQWAARIFHQG